jgi:hypothetical protein
MLLVQSIILSYFCIHQIAANISNSWCIISHRRLSIEFHPNKYSTFARRIVQVVSRCTHAEDGIVGYIIDKFDVTFRKLAGIAPLLEVEDMIRMKNSPDWKCVFTYVQSIYRHLVTMQQKQQQQKKEDEEKKEEVKKDDQPDDTKAQEEKADAKDKAE